MWETDASSFHRFPYPGWAWPQGRLDHLIHAAVATDKEAALEGFKTWLACTDIDDVEFREHRLLAAITERFGKELMDYPEYPRLVGLQRALWTKSRMAIAECTPILQQLSHQKIPTMLLKGAARLALNPRDQKSRISHDLDILVPPSHFRQALAVMKSNDWHSSSGESHLCLDGRSDTLRAMNFFSGRFGDIDLHQWAFGVSEPIESAEQSLWENAIEVDFFGIKLQVPDASDRTSLAIYHSGLDAHNHSDWVVDCAHNLRESGFDWDRFSATINMVDIGVPAEVMLSYLHSRTGVQIPAEFINSLTENKANNFWQRAIEMLQTKPRSDWTTTVKTARGIAKMLRLRRHRKPVSSSSIIKGKIIGKGQVSDFVDKSIVFLNDAALGEYQFELEIEMMMPKLPRRIELELNTDNRHLARLQLKTFRRKTGRFRLRYIGNVSLLESDVSLWAEARPGRYIYANATTDMIERYQKIPFHVVSFKLTPKLSRKSAIP